MHYRARSARRPNGAGAVLGGKRRPGVRELARGTRRPPRVQEASPMKFAPIAVVAGALVALAGTGCTTAPESSEERNALVSESDAALSSFRASDPTLDELMSKAVAYA